MSVVSLVRDPSSHSVGELWASRLQGSDVSGYVTDAALLPPNLLLLA